MFEEQKDTISQLIDNVRQYIKAKEELWKLTLVEKSSRAASAMMAGIFIGTLFLFFFVFISISAAWLLGEYFGKASIGFALIAGFYLLAGAVLYIKREKWLITPIMNSMIRNFLHEPKDEKDQ